MARTPDRDDPLAGSRRLLRTLRERNGAPYSDGPALAGAVEIALYRLSPRQREIVRRYDLGGERASDVQRELALSARQFFRDRRRALECLNRHIFVGELDSCQPAEAFTESRSVAFCGGEAMAGRSLARTLAQSGDATCLGLLQQIAQEASDPVERADTLLELAETAIDYDDERTPLRATSAVSCLLRNGEYARAIADWLLGRVAGVEAKIAKTRHESAAQYECAVSLLQRSVATEPALREPRVALARVLGDSALFELNLGNFVASRSASTQAVALIGTLDQAKRPKMLEILGAHAMIEATSSGRARAAAAEAAGLLRHASEAGWSSTASWLGALVVGLNCIGADYAEAIQWYWKIAPLAASVARPGDSSSLLMQAAHAYTMTGRPREALSILCYVKPGRGCPREAVPDWHVFAAAALDRLGKNRAALRESSEALAGYAAQGNERRMADAHRLIAASQAKLGHPRDAHVHLSEARRMTERYGSPYALMRQLASEALILKSPYLKREATEFTHLLKSLAQS